MSLAGAPLPPSDPNDPRDPLHVAGEGFGPLPVRSRTPRGGAQPREDEGEPEGPYAGCPLFPAELNNNAARFAKFKLTESSGPKLGIRVRLVSPKPGGGGTTRPTFSTPLLDPDTTQDAIHDRWGPGVYEVALCLRSVNDRTKSEVVSRRITCPIRRGGDFGEHGEYDVGHEPWPLSLDEDAAVTDEMRDEIEHRNRVRDELAAEDEGYEGDYGDARASRGGHVPAYAPHSGAPGYGTAPASPYGAAPPPMPSALAYPPDTTFQFVGGQYVPVAPPAPRPSLGAALAEFFAKDPTAALTVSFGVLEKARSVFAPPPPPPTPTAQEIAAATTAAVAQAMGPALQAIAQAVTAKPAGPDPMELLRVELAREREAARAQVAEERAQRERENAQRELAAQREAAERDRKFALELERLRAERRADELRFEVERAKNVTEVEKQSLLRDLDDARKKLRAGEESGAPDWSEKFATIADTKFGEAIAPRAMEILDRIAASVFSGGAPAPAGVPMAPAFPPPVPVPPTFPAGAYVPPQPPPAVPPAHAESSEDGAGDDSDPDEAP